MAIYTSMQKFKYLPNICGLAKVVQLTHGNIC